jgi:hypothetical protein
MSALPGPSSDVSGCTTPRAGRTASWRGHRHGHSGVEAMRPRPHEPRSVRLAERLGERLAGEASVRGHRVTVYALESSAWRAG